MEKEGVAQAHEQWTLAPPTRPAFQEPTIIFGNMDEIQR
jgi:hypothetical protein